MSKENRNFIGAGAYVENQHSCVVCGNNDKSLYSSCCGDCIRLNYNISNCKFCDNYEFTVGDSCITCINSSVSPAEKLWRNIRSTQTGAYAEIHIWSLMKNGVYPYTFKEDDVILPYLEKSFRAGTFISNFVSWKLRHVIQKREFVEKVAIKRWFTIMQIQEGLRTRIVTLKKRLSNKIPTYESISKKLDEMSSRTQYSWEEWSLLFDKSEEVRNDIAGLELLIEEQQEHIDDTDEELEFLEIKYNVKKNIQKQRIKEYKEEIMITTWNPERGKRFGWWSEEGYDLSIWNMMLGL